VGYTTHTRGVLIALAGTTAWATTGIFISVLLNRYQLAPLALAFWRDLFIAVVALAGLRVLRPAALRIGRKDLPFFLCLWVCGAGNLQRHVDLQCEVQRRSRGHRAGL